LQPGKLNAPGLTEDRSDAGGSVGGTISDWQGF